MKAIVVAHPDDEILWFGSEILTADLILICFGRPSNSNTHERLTSLLEMYPLCTVRFLPLCPNSLLDSANWQVIDNNSVIGLKSTPTTGSRIDEIFKNLVSILLVELNECDEVYTHNPWGEYGHEEHIVVSRAVMAVKGKNNVFFSPYYSSKSFHLARHIVEKFELSLVRVPRRVDIDSIHLLRDMYINAGLWTWYKDWRSSAFINFYANKRSSSFISGAVYERFKIK